MTQEVPDLDTKEVDSVLEYTQAKRKFIIEAMTKNNTMPEDPKEQNVLLKALADMDKTVSTRKRLVIEEQSAASAEEQASASAALLQAMRHRMFEAPNPVPRQAPELTDAAIDLVPGETEIGVANLTYDSFIASLPPRADLQSQ
jgi:hypothetical protein